MSVSNGLADASGYERGALDCSKPACHAVRRCSQQPESFSHRYPTQEQIRKWGSKARAFFIEYVDGTRATVLMLNGVVRDFNFAGRVREHDEPLSTLLYLPPNPNVVYSVALMDNAGQRFLTGEAPYPVERTLLTSGRVECGLRSLKKQTRLQTPHLHVTYEPSRESTFWRS